LLVQVDNFQQRLNHAAFETRIQSLLSQVWVFRELNNFASKRENKSFCLASFYAMKSLLTCYKSSCA